MHIAHAHTHMYCQAPMCVCANVGLRVPQCCRGHVAQVLSINDLCKKLSPVCARSRTCYSLYGSSSGGGIVVAVVVVVVVVVFVVSSK